MPVTQATELRVRYAETDRMGIVYYANFLVWCEVGRVEYIRALGGRYAALEAEGYGLETSLTGVRSRAVTFDYVISHAETSVRLATAHTALVSIDRSGRPAALPENFRALLESAL